MAVRIGVGGRLLLAFFAISAFAVLAAAAAMYAFLANSEVLERITQQRVPSALDALELSRQAERIAAAAPALLSAETKAHQLDLSARIRAEIIVLESALSRLAVSEAAGPVAEGTPVFDELASAVSGLRSTLEALDGVVGGRLEVHARKGELTERLLATYEGSQRLLAPWILTVNAEIARLRRKLNDPALAGAGRAAAAAELEGVEGTLRALENARLETSLIDDNLRQAAAAETVDRLRVLAFRVRRSLGAVDGLRSDLDPKLRSLLTGHLETLESLAVGEASIPHVRERELGLVEEAKRLLGQESTLSRQLTMSVDKLVDTTRQDIVDAREEASRVQTLSTAILIAVVLLSVASSLLIVWLYVGRRLVARLTALSDSMLAIAGGDLDAHIPGAGGDEIGQMATALSVFRDTAVEVKETNLREIREARNRLTDAIESISEGFSLYDAEDRLVVCNSRYREIMYPGVAAELTPGTEFESIIRRAAELGLVPEAEGRIEEWAAERLARHRAPSGTHLEHRRKGRWIHISERKTESGGTVAVYADVTEIKRAEEALRASEERYALATEGANEWLWDWLPNEDEVYVSPRFAELAGIEADQPKLSVAQWEACIHPDDLKTHRDAVRRHFRGETPYYEAEYRVRGGDRVYWIHNRGLGLRDETGHVYRMAGSMADISELKAREEELRAAMEAAEEALAELKLTQRSLLQAEKMASLGKLTAGIAHEIKNPLNFINNFSKTSKELVDELAEALASQAAPEVVAELIETVKEDLDTIRQHGERADRIVKGMLLHSRGDAGQSQPTDLNALVGESVNLGYHGQRASTPGFNVTLEMDLDPRVGELELVPQDVTRVLVNLLGNAFYAVHQRAQAAPAGYAPTVRVSSRLVDGDWVEVRVRDNGPGIASDALDQLFTPFFTTKPAGEGTGLGLSISHDIVVDGHGGRLRAESALGEYAEFVVELPRRRSGAGKAVA